MVTESREAPSSRTELIFQEISSGTLLVTLENLSAMPSLIKSQPWNKPEGAILLGGTRGCYIASTDLIKVVVKPKLTETFLSLYHALKDVKRPQSEYLFGSPLPPEIEMLQKDEELKAIAQASVLYEMKIYAEAVKKYQEKFGEEPPIEKPIGAFVGKDGQKATIYELISGEIVPEEEIEKSKTIKQEKEIWTEEMKKRFSSLGINPADFQAVVVKDNSKQGYRFVIIDIELWRRKVKLA